MTVLSARQPRQGTPLMITCVPQGTTYGDSAERITCRWPSPQGDPHTGSDWLAPTLAPCTERTDIHSARTALKPTAVPCTLTLAPWRVRIPRQHSKESVQ